MENVGKAKKMTGLGRGLGALLQDSDSVNRQSRPSPTETVSMMNEIHVEQIEVNPYQPRTHFDGEALQELAESIRYQGIIQPITVRQIGRDRYQLISGERRLQASKIAGLTHIPSYVRTANDQQMLEMALIENIQRENLNAVEIALSYQRLITDCGLKQEELGERVGKNRTTVNNYIRLLKLPPIIQAAVRDNQISMGHARAIINIENPETQLKMFRKTVEEEWSVRRVEDEVRNLQLATEANANKERRPNSLKHEFRSLQFKLSSLFGTKVSIKSDDKDKGEIKIPFTSQEELERILKSIQFES
ncbi:MAG: ParB/RepB/Spo0J family partition protein [Runella slithyformis]|nr:MAG: ParB/RepB/Spo0J family partition protein [Runella slithyformis]TAF27718.1 MAG: ParB/RepB/Spo0J family partition protein [Runella slithyformis]TAF44604.1 MAG: ParB/RepB/Spo0J family partition protein [Runella slithyformis]TAF80891.1 MAG: ParB/RepB/Spo0J family partition protein [Runella slithyformis]